MSKECAACKTLAIAPNTVSVALSPPLFLERIIFARVHQPHLAFYACMACDQQWAWRKDQRTWQPAAEVFYRQPDLAAA